jgi:hypothetical protein
MSKVKGGCEICHESEQEECQKCSTATCTQGAHPSCVGMHLVLTGAGKASVRTWKCSKCCKGNISPTAAAQGQFTFSEYMPVLQAKMSQKFVAQTIKECLDRNSAELKVELEQLQKVITDQNLKINALEKQIAENKHEICDQKECNAALHVRVNELEQEKLALNVEILGVEKTQNENLNKLVEEIAQVMNVPETADNIEAVYRGRSIKNKPQAIVVKFKYAEDREKWLKRKRSEEFKNFAVKAPYSAVAAAPDGSRPNVKSTSRPPPISIYEMLTYHNRQLLFDTRTAATKKEMKFVWTKGGKIFVRKDEHTPVVVRIRSSADIITKISLTNERERGNNETIPKQLHTHVTTLTRNE